jgi:hypothetical protein
LAEEEEKVKGLFQSHFQMVCLVTRKNECRRLEVCSTLSVPITPDRTHLKKLTLNNSMSQHLDDASTLIGVPRASRLPAALGRDVAPQAGAADSLSLATGAALGAT